MLTFVCSVKRSKFRQEPIAGIQVNTHGFNVGQKPHIEVFQRTTSDNRLWLLHFLKTANTISLTLTASGYFCLIMPRGGGRAYSALPA